MREGRGRPSMEPFREGLGTGFNSAPPSAGLFRVGGPSMEGLPIKLVMFASVPLLLPMRLTVLERCFVLCCLRGGAKTVCLLVPFWRETNVSCSTFLQWKFRLKNMGKSKVREERLAHTEAPFRRSRMMSEEDRNQAPSSSACIEDASTKEKTEIPEEQQTNEQRQQTTEERQVKGGQNRNQSPTIQAKNGIGQYRGITNEGESAVPHSSNRNWQWSHDFLSSQDFWFPRHPALLRRDFLSLVCQVF